MTWVIIALLSAGSFYVLYLDPSSGLIVGEDVQYELVRLVEFKEALKTQYYPRLAPDLYYGYGSPIFVFYPPLFLLLTSLADLLLDNLNHSAKLVVVGLGLSGSFFCYAFLRLFVRGPAAMFGTLFYIFAPYKFIDLYKRCALAEYTAMNVLPARTSYKGR
jgi:hypothetical protein